MNDSTYSARLFLALWPDDAAKKKLTTLAKQLVARCPGRNIRPENLHLTLAFIGEVDSSNILRLSQAAPAIQRPSFNLALDEVYFWKKSGVMVAGTSHCPTELTTLVQDVRYLLRSLKIQYDDTSPFAPHVTLVRNVNRCRLFDSIPAIDWSVTQWSLVQSHRTLSGSIYQSFADWPLEIQDSNEHHRF